MVYTFLNSLLLRHFGHSELNDVIQFHSHVITIHCICLSNQCSENERDGYFILNCRPGIHLLSTTMPSYYQGHRFTTTSQKTALSFGLLILCSFIQIRLVGIRSRLFQDMTIFFTKSACVCYMNEILETSPKAATQH